MIVNSQHEDNRNLQFPEMCVVGNHFVGEKNYREFIIMFILKVSHQINFDN